MHQNQRNRKEPGLNVISSHAAERSPSCRGDITVEDEPYPAPRGSRPRRASFAATATSQSHGEHAIKHMFFLRLPSRPVPSVPIEVDIEHFQSFEIRVRASRQDWRSSPTPSPPPVPPFHFRLYFSSMALPDWGNGHHDSGSMTHRYLITPRDFSALLWDNRRLV